MSADENAAVFLNESRQHEVSPHAETEDDQERRHYIDTDRFELGVEEEDRDDKAPEFQEKWSELFARLKAFKEEHGHCLVPNRYPEDPQLGSWGKHRICYFCPLVSIFPPFSHALNSNLRFSLDAAATVQGPHFWQRRVDPNDTQTSGDASEDWVHVDDNRSAACSMGLSL